MSGCEVKPSGWFEWGVGHDCSAQVPWALAVVFTVSLLGTVVWLYWYITNDR